MVYQVFPDIVRIKRERKLLERREADVIEPLLVLLERKFAVMDVALAGCRDISAILDSVVRRHVANTGAQLGWEHKK